MEFVKGTFHIFLFYFFVCVIFCLPPYIKAWLNLVNWLNRIQVKASYISRAFYFFMPGVIFIALVLTHLFQFHKELRLSFWLVFVPSAFLVIPFMTAFFGIASFSKAKERIGLGYLSILIFSYAGFGVSASNIHDVIWCARATNFYREFSAGGDDLFLWVKIFQPPSYDYRTFGFYMLFQVLIALLVAHICYFKFLRVGNLRRDFHPLVWNWLAMATLAFAITLIDFPDILKPPFLHSFVIGFAIFLSGILFNKSGLSFSKLT